MALGATVFRCELQVSDMDRGYYATHDLTVAQHPSETDERMMVRILAFALHADERLSFTRGISTDDEPDLWLRALNDDIALWIELGQPDEKRIRRACGRARGVVVYGYQARAARVWWEQIKGKLSRFDHLQVRVLADTVAAELGVLVQRGMRFQVMIQDGEAWVSDDRHQVRVTWESLK
ncbi:MAG: YaeQ family protein [Gammaproteobacteria bacterium]|nr:YaeQ family protein [Gammaproteobacteria bacterium]MCP5135753.1 YaeQ family protein [Gammaproteobacteria bacterium]